MDDNGEKTQAHRREQTS